MTESIKIAGFALMAALCAFSLKAFHKQAGISVALAAGMMLFFYGVQHLTAISQSLRQLSNQAGLGNEGMQWLLKLLAMAYIGEFSVQACRDAGEEGLALKAALCGKMLLIAQTLPLVGEISQLTLSLLP